MLVGNNKLLFRPKWATNCPTIRAPVILLFKTHSHQFDPLAIGQNVWKPWLWTFLGQSTPEVSEIPWASWLGVPWPGSPGKKKQASASIASVSNPPMYLVSRRFAFVVFFLVCVCVFEILNKNQHKANHIPIGNTVGVVPEIEAQKSKNGW